MLHIYCPYCQEPRGEEEFSYSGEAHIQRPLDPDALTDQQWGDYLFFRNNPRGLHNEMWYHAVGCCRYFNVSRNTVTYEILETYPVGTHANITESSVEGEPR